MPEPPPPRLLDRVRGAVRACHFSRRTEKAYVAWIRRLSLFHEKRHPVDMGAREVSKFLSALAMDRDVAPSNQALSALLRVKNIDFARHQLVVRGGKGDKDRVAPLPAVVAADLARHLEAVKRQHEEDLQRGAGVPRPAKSEKWSILAAMLHRPRSQHPARYTDLDTR